MTTAIDKTVKGVLGEKLGMTQVWDDENRLVPVTVIQAGPCVVTQVRNEETDGYKAVQIAAAARHDGLREGRGEARGGDRRGAEDPPAGPLRAHGGVAPRRAT